jgi:hypothetical protein
MKRRVRLQIGQVAPRRRGRIRRLFASRHLTVGDMWLDMEGNLLVWHGWWEGWHEVTPAGDYRLPQYRDGWYQ